MTQAMMQAMMQAMTQAMMQAMMTVWQKFFTFVWNRAPVMKFKSILALQVVRILERAICTRCWMRAN